VAQHRVTVRGRERRIDLCYPDLKVALEAEGFDHFRLRERHDSDALRGNALKLAGFLVLEFTTAFSDWEIARDVAEAIGHPVPTRPARAISFEEWCASR
jgi:very-short-patch-repair endonuclease